MKNAKDYIKLYKQKAEESFKDWGYYYPPRNWEEFYDWENQTYEKHLVNREDDPTRTKLYVSLLDTTTDFGFYLALQKADYGLLNNVLYQTSRHKLLNLGMTASGTDHCHALMDALAAFACNDFDVIDYFFPQSLPHADGRFYTEVSVNLLNVCYYREKELKAEALKKAEQFLAKKITLWEKHVVSYFMALTHRDSEDASHCLQQLCLAYQKMEHSVDSLDNKLAKCFAPEIHGLYRFARLIDEGFFKEISHPKHPCFWEEFEVWQQENGFPTGRLFYRRPAEIGYMNDILEAPLPTVALQEVRYTGKNKTYKDVEKFARDLTANAYKTRSI